MKYWDCESLTKELKLKEEAIKRSNKDRRAEITIDEVQKINEVKKFRRPLWINIRLWSLVFLEKI